MSRRVVEFLYKQCSACLFGVFLIVAIVTTYLWYPIDSLARYDFLFLIALGFQFVLIVSNLETIKEAVVILVFHVLATIMELFKTSNAIGSWTYPDEFFFGIATVPLFAGFMYSAVGSYIARTWRLFNFNFLNYPRKVLTTVLVVLIYLNFFGHHYVWDLRWILLGISVILFWRTKLVVQLSGRTYQIALLLAWTFFAILIWIAENIATYAEVWLYPNQMAQWQPVSIGKLTSWYLLMLLSFVLVSLLHKTHVSQDVHN